MKTENKWHEAKKINQKRREIVNEEMYRQHLEKYINVGVK
jgi:hypothetical protein